MYVLIRSLKKKTLHSKLECRYLSLMLKSLWLKDKFERLDWGETQLPCTQPDLSFIQHLSFSHPLLSILLFFFPPITSTLTAYFCSPVVTNVAFSASLNRLTPKQATHSDTGSKTVHPCAALNPAQARLRRGKLRCVVTDQRLVSKFVQRRGSDVKCTFPRARCFPLASWSRTHWRAELWDGLLPGEWLHLKVRVKNAESG